MHTGHLATYSPFILMILVPFSKSAGMDNDDDDDVVVAFPPPPDDDVCFCSVDGGGLERFPPPPPPLFFPLAILLPFPSFLTTTCKWIERRGGTVQ